MQRRQCHVRARVGVVDRIDLVTDDQHLRRVELPVEERVDDAADRSGLPPGLLGEEVMGHRVAVVHRLVGPEVHHHGLGADGQCAGEVLEVDGRLEMHQHLARLVVGAVQVLAVADAGDATPAAAVERLHVERVAQLLGDPVEVEGLVVPVSGVGPAHVVHGVLVGHQRGGRHLQAQPHHRAVGAVLLHRLEREGAVEQVGAVDQCCLLQPLTRVVVPVGEPVDDQRCPHRVVEPERLDRQPLAGDRVLGAAVGHRPDHPLDGLEGSWPVLLGSEQQSDQVAAHPHLPLPTRPGLQPVSPRPCRSTGQMSTMTS